MPLYPFETQLVLASDATGIVVANALVTIYAPSDTNRTSPLTLTDPTGLPLSNPLQASAQGFLPAFQASMAQVMWSGGGYIGYLNSFKGMLDAAVAAQAAAEAAQASATGLPAGGTDGQVLGRAAGQPVWVAAPSSSVSPADVDTIVANAVQSGTGAAVGALDNRYKQDGITPISELPAGSTLVVRKTGSTWPARPTTRTDIVVIWVGVDPDPAIITTGTGGALSNVDIRMAI